jgi:GNAT superfamily N-acetyltransferase
MKPWTIRDARPEDRDVLVEFNRRLALESEDKVLDPPVLTQGVANILADCQRGRYFVATVGDDIIGQVSVTYEWSDWRNGTIWWIQSVYVRADYRGKGVYRSLHEHVEQLARSTPGIIGLRLYVENHNRSAQAVYESVGLKKIPFQLMERLWLHDPTK